jgi:hypothetical protein
MGKMLTAVIRTRHVAKLLVPDEKFSENNEGRRGKKSGRNWRSLLIISEISGRGFKNILAVMLVELNTPAPLGHTNIHWV